MESEWAAQVGGLEAGVVTLESERCSLPAGRRAAASPEAWTRIALYIRSKSSMLRMRRCSRIIFDNI